MKDIHQLTEVFGLNIREHFYECLETTFRFEICDLNYSLKVSCLSQIQSPYFLKVNAHWIVKILLKEEIFVLWLDEVKSFNIFSCFRFKLIQFLLLLSLFFKFIDFSLIFVFYINFNLNTGSHITIINIMGGVSSNVYHIIYFIGYLIDNTLSHMLYIKSSNLCLKLFKNKNDVIK